MAIGVEVIAEVLVRISGCADDLVEAPCAVDEQGEDEDHIPPEVFLVEAHRDELLTHGDGRRVLVAHQLVRERRLEFPRRRAAPIDVDLARRIAPVERGRNQCDSIGPDVALVAIGSRAHGGRVEDDLFGPYAVSLLEDMRGVALATVRSRARSGDCDDSDAVGDDGPAEVGVVARTARREPLMGWLRLRGPRLDATVRRCAAIHRCRIGIRPGPGLRDITERIPRTTVQATVEADVRFVAVVEAHVALRGRRSASRQEQQREDVKRPSAHCEVVREAHRTNRRRAMQTSRQPSNAADRPEVVGEPRFGWVSFRAVALRTLTDRSKHRGSSGRQPRGSVRTNGIGRRSNVTSRPCRKQRSIAARSTHA